MSLFGAMFAGVSGLDAQSKKIGSISDNIANVSTVGYKRADTQFETLVIGSSSSTSPVPGGVLARSRNIIDQQGILVNSSAVTDLAISGDGFFVVRQSEGTTPLYTRAGSFRTNADGNLENSAGFLLQGWPLDSQGRLPGDPGNANTTASSSFDSLETVNITSASGIAKATTAVEISANLDSRTLVYPGAEGTIAMDALSTSNYGIGSQDIITSSEYDSANVNSIVRGDKFRVTTGSGLRYDFTYGGFAVGRDATVAIAASSPGNGDGGDALLPAAFAPTSMATVNTSNVITVTLAAHGLHTGASVTFAGLPAINGIAAPLVNQTHTITYVDDNTFTITVGAAATSTGAGSGASGTSDTRQFAGNILDATTSSQVFLGTTGTSRFSTDALSFTIGSATAGTQTFTYNAGSPNTAVGQFNNLNNLAEAIENVVGLTARVVGSRLYVSAEDASEALTFTNGDTTGTEGPPAGTGINWVQELGLANVAAGSDRFNTLGGLQTLADSKSGISSNITNPSANSQVTINVDDPLDTITFDDFVQTPVTNLGTNPFTVAGGASPYTVTVSDPSHGLANGDNVVIAGATAFGGLLASDLNGTHTITYIDANSYSFQVTTAAVITPGAGGGTSSTRALTNQGSILAELGLVTSLNGATYSPQQTTALGPKYDATGSAGENMASGDITPSFYRQMRVYDSLGNGHDITAAFLKIDTNEWAVEVYSAVPGEIATTLVDEQIATGTIAFNGDGSLRSISNGLDGAIDVIWTNGADVGSINFDWGTAGPVFGTPNAVQFGLTDGLRQFAADSDVNFVNQDGAPSGYLISVSVDADGFVTANFSNGETQALYKLPMADFANPNGLQAITGNVFSQTQESGDTNLREAGANGVGTFQSGALESSNVDLAKELTEMIVAQRAYQSNTRSIQTADQLLEALTNIGR